MLKGEWQRLRPHSAFAAHHLAGVDLDILAIARVRLTSIDDVRMLVVFVVPTLAMGRLSLGSDLSVAASTIGTDRKARQTRLEGDEDGQEDGERTSDHWRDNRQTGGVSQAKLRFRAISTEMRTQNLRGLLREKGSLSPLTAPDER